MTDTAIEFGGEGATSGALRNAFARAGAIDPASGTAPTEATVHAVTEAIGFHHATVGRGASARLLLGFGRSGISAGSQALAQGAACLGLTQESVAPDSDLAAENQVVEAIDRGVPVLAWTDPATLPHRAMPRGQARAIPHLLGVVAFHEEVDEFELDDGSRRAIPIDAPRLRLARAEVHGARNRAILLRRGAAPLPVRLGPLEVARNALMAHLDAPIANRGVAGMRNLAERIIVEANPRHWSRAFPRGSSRVLACLALYRSIEHGDYGSSAGRRLWVSFLAELAQAPGWRLLQPELETWRQVADAWSDLARSALPEDVRRLAEARSLVDTQCARYRRDGIDASGLLASTRARLSGIEMEMRVDYPLGEADSRDHLRELGGQLARLATMEEEASTRLLQLVR